MEAHNFILAAGINHKFIDTTKSLGEGPATASIQPEVFTAGRILAWGEKP